MQHLTATGVARIFIKMAPRKDINLAKRLKYLRGCKSISQAKLAGKIGVVCETYQRYESGDMPSRERIDKLVEFYSCSKAWLLTGEGQPYSDKAGAPIYNKEEKPVEMKLNEPAPVYAPRGRANPKEWEIIGKAHEILNSQTLYAAALATNINAFHAAISAENEMKSIQKTHKDLIDKIDKLFDGQIELSSKITHLETVRWAKDRVRENDPPE